MEPARLRRTGCISRHTRSSSSVTRTYVLYGHKWAIGHFRACILYALSAVGVIVLLGVGCSPSPQPDVPATPSPTALMPNAAEAEEPPCTTIGVTQCDAYLKTAAECFRRTPLDTRSALREDLRRHCKEW